MKIAFDIDSLPLEEQEAIFKHLKHKFEAVQLDENFTVLDKNIYDDCLRGIISVNTYNILREINIKTLRDMINLKRNEVRDRRGIGTVKLKKLELYMKLYGLKFIDEDDDQDDISL